MGWTVEAGGDAGWRCIDATILFADVVFCRWHGEVEVGIHGNVMVIVLAVGGGSTRFLEVAQGFGEVEGGATHLAGIVCAMRWATAVF